MTARLCTLTYNIRYNNPADGANAWPQRQARVAGLLQTHQPDLIGFQEVRHEQLKALATALPAHDWLGVGRDDGVAAGEYAPIFYRRARLALQESGHFWLSETPIRSAALVGMPPVYALPPGRSSPIEQPIRSSCISIPISITAGCARNLSR